MSDLTGNIDNCQNHPFQHLESDMLLFALCRDYVISYDRRNRTAHWVFEHLTRESVKRNEAVDRTKSEFKEDNSIHRFFRAQG